MMTPPVFEALEITLNSIDDQSQDRAGATHARFSWRHRRYLLRNTISFIRIE